MFTRIKLLIALSCFTVAGFVTLATTRTQASEFITQAFQTTSALIIVLRRDDGQPLHIRRYGGFSRNHSIGPYIKPAYLEPKQRLPEQRYTGFKRIYKDRCYRCQRYSGFKKTYRGKNYPGFTDNGFRAGYLDGPYRSTLRIY